MKSGTKALSLFSLLIVGAIANPSLHAAEWKENLKAEDTSFSSTGRNPFWVLEPGYQLVLDGKEDKKSVHLTITVLEETKKVDNVETRVVEERETENGQLVEVARNYFALGNQTHTLYYFGEDVDMYKNGKLANHEGSWLSGIDGAKYGIMIPGTAKSGDKYYQENAPGKAMDRGENLSMDTTVKTPAGDFKGCLKVRETSPLEKDTVEQKIYAPDIGIVQDDTLKLVSHGFVKK
ncbi:hypothetical protein [Pedosphaera parvula]|nr:hypothetical protein [Pedosphaera parvula]